MNQVLQYPGEFVLETASTPSICAVLPFEPQVNEKSSIEGRLRSMMAKVEARLLQKYSTHKALPVLTKLQQLISGINFYNYKKSIAILASPYTARIFYLDFPVTETLRIDESIDIRSIVRAKKNSLQFLVLVLGNRSARVLMGSKTHLSCIKYNMNGVDGTPAAASPERMLLDGFVHKMDQGLGLILNAYPLPVFVLGEETTIKLFKNTTAHAEQVITYLPGNFETTPEKDMLMTLQPNLDHWKSSKQQVLFQQLEKAKQEGKLACGVKEVWNTATHKRGQLLVVEENLVSLADEKENESTGHQVEDPYHMKDLVDDIIEKVLKDGGDVEFVDKGMLGRYQQIALIECHKII